MDLKWDINGDDEEFYPEVSLGGKVDGHEGEPQDTRAVHREADMPSLVEVLRDFAGFKCVDGTTHNEEEIIGQGHEEMGSCGLERRKLSEGRGGGHLAGEDSFCSCREDDRSSGWLDNQPDEGANKLERDDPHAYQDLESTLLLEIGKV